MTYNTKAEFMAALKSQAEKYSLSFGEMAEDFERHFSEGEENGETESEICAKLGDPVEIVKEYVGENSENAQSSNSNEQNITAGVNRVDSNTGKISGGMITGVILLDLFVLDCITCYSLYCGSVCFYCFRCGKYHFRYATVCF